MKVKFRNRWFGPSEAYILQDRRAISGVEYLPGEIYELDEDMRDRLPKSAEIIEDKKDKAAPPPAVREKEGETLADFDDLRTADDEVTERLQKLDKSGKK